MGLEHSGYEEREECFAAVYAARPGKDRILDRPHVIRIAGAGDLKYAVPLIRVSGRADVARSFPTRMGYLPVGVGAG